MKLFNDLINLFNDEKIDLINLQVTKKLYLVNEVFQTGMCIFEDGPNLFSKMKWGAWMNYQDFKRYYDRQNQLSQEYLEGMI